VQIVHGDECAARRRPGSRGIAESFPGSWPTARDANFLFVRVPTEASRVLRGLLGYGVLVKDVSRTGPLDRCLRITVGTSLENERCARALRRLLEDR